MFYINFLIENVLYSFIREKCDNLLYWKYVLKREKFFLNLLVDFDLIIFNLLLWKEEKFLGIKMYYNDISCFENFDFVIKFFWFLLWNEFFDNDISYYFCNIFFEDVDG